MGRLHAGDDAESFGTFPGVAGHGLEVFDMEPVVWCWNLV